MQSDSNQMSNIRTCTMLFYINWMCCIIPAPVKSVTPIKDAEPISGIDAGPQQQFFFSDQTPYDHLYFQPTIADFTTVGDVKNVCEPYVYKWFVKSCMGLKKKQFLCHFQYV